MAARYTLKVQVLEAIQYKGDNQDELMEFCPDITYEDGVLDIQF